MSFLRKWGSSSGPAATSTGGGTAGAGGAAAAEATKAEWFNETPGERYFGMENFGNTCYANSVLQSLYFSKPFRELVEAYSRHGPPLPIPSPSSANVALARGSASSASSQPKSPARTAAAPLPSSTSQSTSSRGAGVAGGGRSGMFGGHKRAPSVQGQETASSADSTFSANSSTNGAPLAQTLTHTSFTGVGTPLLANGTLAHERPTADSTLLTTLHDLFVAISAQPKTLGTVAPQAFINQLKRDNEFFRSTLHQDAHEFLNYLVNMIAEALEKEEKERTAAGHPSILGEAFQGSPKTWVHRLFEGVLTNETRCLACETVTSRDEAFLDLSIDIEQNSSVTACLRQFSASEMLCQRNKFFCDKCCGLQEAEKRMKIKKLPNILALHLKRFKYEESLQRHVKLTYRVVFPFELRLPNTADGVSNPDRLYELWAIVVHIGVGPHHGHYITIVKSGIRWIVFDDNNVYPIDEADISKYFGDTPGQGSGYVLFYQAADLDLDGLGLRNPSRERQGTASSVSTAPPNGSWTTEPVPTAPLTASALGLALSEHDFASGRPPAHPSQPLSPKSTSGPLDPPPPLDVAAQPSPFGTLSTPSPPSLFSGSATSVTNSRKSSAPSEASIEHDVEAASVPKEGSGWTLKGRKLSVGGVSGRIGRSLSLASSNGNKDSPRAVSTPMSASAETDALPLPMSKSNSQLSPLPQESTPPLSSSTPSSSFVRPPIPSFISHGAAPSPSPAGELTPLDQVPPPSTPPFPLPFLPNHNNTSSHPPPPSDDGSVSTVSTQGLAPLSAASAPSPQRRGSKASVDLNGSSTNASATASASGGSSSALAATRNFLSRKPRPLSTVSGGTSSGSSSPNPSAVGLGIARPSTAGGRLASSTVSTNGASTPLAPIAGGGEELAGAALRSSPSMIVSKKDMEKAEKRLKEERKLREKEEKKRAEERSKRLKEEERKAKEEAKKADKLRRKASVR